MFSASDVNTLFAETNTALRRALLLVEEKGRAEVGTAADPQSSSSSSPSYAPLPPLEPGYYSKGLATLSSISLFENYVEAAAAMGGRLQEEMEAPSAAVQRQRSKGKHFPLLRKVVAGLEAQRMWADSNECRQLWWPEAEGGGSHAASGEGMDVVACGSPSGASLSALLLLAACGVDALHQFPAARAACEAAVSAVESAAPWAESVGVWLSAGGGAPSLSSALALVLPAPVAASLRQHVVAMLSAPFRDADRALVARGAVPPLPSGLCLYPSLLRSVAVEGRQAIAAPTEQFARRLPALFLSSASAECFDAACRCLVRFVCLVSLALRSGSGNNSNSNSSPSAEDQAARVDSLLKVYLNALVAPLEDGFRPETARPGVSLALYNAVAAPFRRYMRAITGGGRDDGVVCTAYYRLLVVVGNLGKAEAVVLSGEGNAVLQEKKYAELLRQAHGKMSLPLLTAVLEARQLTIEPTAMRSGSGHKLHRIHTGGEEDSATARRGVLAYLSDGLLFYKRPGQKDFTKAQGVEEVVKLL